MAFHDVQLPDDIERGAQGGPRFKTTILTLVGGAEQRNIDWQQTRAAYDISYGIVDADDVDAGYDLVREFYYARKGRGHSFRFKDWTDFEMDRQIIGATDGSLAIFQIFKRYTSGGFDHDRTLEKIVSGSLSVWVNNAAITEGAGASEYQVDLLTGIITIGSTLAAQSGTDVEALTEFDVPVRFADDAMDVAAMLATVGNIPAIPLIEVKGE